MRPAPIIAAIAIPALLAIAWLQLPQPLTAAPAVEVPTIDGRSVRIGAGEPMLVTFWSITCSTCLREVPELNRLHTEFAGDGLRIVGIAMWRDPPSHVVTTARARGMRYDVALDIDGAAAGAFGGITGTPTSFLLAPDGQVLLHHVGGLDFDALREKIRRMVSA